MGDYDTMMVQSASEHFKDDDFTPVTFEEATAGLATTEAWVDVAVNGLLCNAVFDKAKDELDEHCDVPDPIKPMAKQLIRNLTDLVQEFIAIAPTATLVDFTSADIDHLRYHFQKGGIAKVLTSWLNSDCDWPNDDTQSEARHDD